MAPGRCQKRSIELAHFVAALTIKAGLSTKLAELRVAYDKLPQLAAEAAKQWTGSFNPRKVGPDELLTLYQEAF